MIVTQSHKRRAFVGSLNHGSDLIEAIRSLCVDNTVLCGFFQATGYLEDVRLQTFDAVQKSYREPELHRGTFHGVAITGNISLVERQTAIRCHVTGSVVPTAGGVPYQVSGELVAGKVVGLEFMLDTIDDLRLYRARDERSGLDGWLHIEFVQGGNPIVRTTPPAEAPTQAPAPRGEPARAEPAPAPARRAPVAAAAEEIRQDIRIGDFLNHPTLGRCVVVSTENEERLTIRLESGRNVELHTGLVDIAPARTGPDGERVFAVAIRRRR
ncbi:MAG: DUF296 domain-containing protein [Deltaproteobacteria bacterium]|jgi:predicted DNA-binding protein with PD1-like motif|nr:DUF296 domain-containing protein [Deltaproteobacteria bacterium]